MNPCPETAPPVTVPLSQAQYRWLENAARFVADETGCEVTIASLMLRLMDLGRKDFERELEELRARSNQRLQRFPRLELAYSRIVRR